MWRIRATVLVSALILVNAGAPLARASGNWSSRAVPGDGDAIVDVSCYTSSHCVGVSQHSRQVIVSDNAGASWRTYRPRTVGRFGFTAVSCAGAGVCYASSLIGALPTVGGALYRSRDGGRHWRQIYRVRTPKNAAYKFNNVYCLNARTCLLSGTTGHAGFILRSTNAGRSWRPTTLPHQPASGSIRGLDCVGARCFAVQGARALVYRSTNAGRTWTSLPVPRRFRPYESNPATPTGLDAISCGSAAFCVAGGYIGHLNLQGTSEPFKWVTHNAGRTWSFANPFASTGAKTPSAVSQGAISCTGPHECTMGLFYGDIYTTNDAGRTWTWDRGAPNTDSNVLSVTCVTSVRCLVTTISNFPQRSTFAGRLWLRR